MIYKYRIFVDSREGAHMDIEGEKLTFQSWVDTEQKNSSDRDDILNSFTFSVSTDNPEYPVIRKQLRDCLDFLIPYFTEAQNNHSKVHLIIDFYSYGYQTYVNIDDFFSVHVTYSSDIQETEEDNTNGINIETKLTFRNK